MYKKFIDISEHNTITSLGAIGTSNLAGVIMKASEGTTYQDHSMEKYYNALNGNIQLGFYHFLRATSSPDTQAQNFWNCIKDKKYEIFPVLDVESNGDNDELGEFAEKYCEEFISEFYRLSGQNMIIYSGRYYIEEHFSLAFRQSHVFWVADYGDDVPELYGCNICAWQYTESSEEYAFSNGGLDVNILLNEDIFFIDNQIPFSEEFEISDVFSIEWLQNQLNNQGHTDKNDKPLEVDGIAGELTLSALPILRIGTIGLLTKYLQSNLDNVVIDGYFGEQTRQAVIQYQEDRSLDGDGIVGEKTWRKILGM